MEKSFISNTLDNSLPAMQLELRGAEVYPARDSTDLFLPLNSSVNSFLKRITDIIVSLIIIVFLLSWVLPLLAFMVKISSRGPAFFIQKRNARFGKIFRCYKLRTMSENTEADILPAQENDSRITKFGFFLRKYHLDELPQFINVFVGDMSLVGPRPYMIYENEYYSGLIRGFEFRHSIRPGITGLAQSHGQFGTITEPGMMRSRLALDQYYILNWSLLLDLKIVLRTLKQTIA